jgi:hypothetical protein
MEAKTYDPSAMIFCACSVTGFRNAAPVKSPSSIESAMPWKH